MKILAIRGRNLASLEGGFEIDFTVEPLLSAGIFAISGPTGAGKSTILDAMCLSLFARTPRTDQAKENNVKLQDVNNEVLPQSDPRFLLRRGTAAGYAEVDFVALNGHRYRARWSVGRARDKENGRLQNPKTALFNLDKEIEEQGTRSELQARIIELIGLNFEQFTRSVLLAQNDFSTFLKAEQSEKASLLEKLTGTELYSVISRSIFEKNARAKEAFDTLNIRIQGIELLNEEEEKNLQERLIVLESVLSGLEKAKKEQQDLQENVRATEQFIISRKNRQQEAESRLSRASELLTVARRDYEKGLEEQQQSEAAYKTQAPEIRQARKIDVRLEHAVRDFTESEQQKDKAVGHRKEAESNYQAALLRRQQGAAEIARLAEWREKYKSKERIAGQLSALLLHIDAASVARALIEKSSRAVSGIRKEDGELSRELMSLQKTLDKKQAALREAESSYRSMEAEQKKIDVPVLEKETERLRQERERLLVEQARLAASGNIRELRDKLQEGQPCPVCGSLHHPAVAAQTGDIPLVSSREGGRLPIDTLTLQIRELTTQKEKFVALSKQLSALQQQQFAFHKELTETEVACKDIVARRKLLAAQLLREETVVGEQTDVLSRSLTSADQLFGNSDWQKGWQQNPDAFRKTLIDFARQWQENNERLVECQRQQSARDAECESLASFLPSLCKISEEAHLLFEKNRRVLASLQAERAKLLEGRAADAVEQEHTRRTEVLRERLKQLSAVQAEQSGIVEQSRGISEQIAKDLAEASAELVRRQAALDKWTADYLVSSGGEALAIVSQRTAQEKAELTFRLRTQAENKTKVAGLKDELCRLRTESERWGRLNELAGSADGAKFRRIAQGYTLDVLLSYANVQLRNLTRRYQLERVPETLALQVIDRDMCDEIRTVHSLSGGESFLVSLALALGLSSLSSNRMRVESLFIDEGFGSLDADTLRIAMDALESLRTQGRKIGVISHVQEMTERIPVQIRVNRAGNGRSYIEIV